MGLPELRTPPFITRAVPDEKGGVDIAWEFDPANEALIESFSLERSEDDKNFSNYITPIDKTQRSINVPNAPATSYFAITANSIAGKRIRSFTTLVQLVDTLPPVAPVGLEAIADTTGVVKLSWQANSDKGRFGYRIYRGQTAEEELVPLNDVAHRDTVFVDSINLRTLNRNIYYAVTALDERYNQSEKSQVVEVKRPEVIPPTPPFIREVRVENGRNMVIWVSGGESNLAGYNLYRQSMPDSVFTLLDSIPYPEIFEYEDRDVENNRTYIYRVLSRSEGGLISDPSPDYKVKAINKSAITVPVTFELSSSADKISLGWNVPVTDIINIQLYKKSDGGSFGLMSEGLASDGKIEDTDVIPGVRYQYMLVVKSNGAPPVNLIKEGAL
jgi:fibronectin type 3 domain-containing protein